jgi:hypothetical protein
VNILIDLSKYSEKYIDSVILKEYNEICVLPEWAKDIKYDFLILPPTIMWYPDCSNRDANKNIFLAGTTVFSTPDTYKNMEKPMNNKTYARYFHSSLLELLIRIGFFRVGLLNETAMRYKPFEEQVRGVVMHEWRHVLQRLYILKMDFRTKGNKYSDISGMNLYSSPDQIIEEDAREVQYTRPDKPIEEFYEEYKRYEYIYLRRNTRHRGKPLSDLVLED